MAGKKDDPNTFKTTAIDWFVKMNQGFTYHVRTVSAPIAVPSELGSCADDATGSTNLTVNEDGAHERFRLSGLQTYAEYQACVQATNDEGMSGWTEIGDPIPTLPAKPGALRNSSTTDTASTNVTATLGWSFAGSATAPENPGDYDAAVYSAFYAASDTTKPTLSGVTCENADSNDAFATLSQTVKETGSGFAFVSDLTVTLNRAAPTETASTASHTILALACVRAHLPGEEDEVGPWTSLSTTKTVSVPKQQ